VDAQTPYPDTLAPNARAIFADLCSSLPKTAEDTEEALAAHARKAMQAVFALRPEDDFEALLATRIVAMNAHAMDALRSAALAAGDPGEVRRCRAQAASMARQSDSTLRTLRRMQAERDKAFNEGHPATLGRAGYWFHVATIIINELIGNGRPVPKLDLETDIHLSHQIQRRAPRPRPPSCASQFGGLPGFSRIHPCVRSSSVQSSANYRPAVIVASRCAASRSPSFAALRYQDAARPGLAVVPTAAMLTRKAGS
jgi:hypothetical protein